MKKVIEKHISVLSETHDKLKQLAKHQKRSMRTVVDMLIDEAYKKEIKDK